MAGRQFVGDGTAASLAGMSKNQLYDIMSQMKALIEQNHQQAREILIQNPLLTKTLFQAQIMLGMVQPPQVLPKIQVPASQQPQPLVQPPQQLPQPPQQPNPQTAHQYPGKIGFPDQGGVSQTQFPTRNHSQSQPGMPIASASVPSANLQPLPSHALQPPQQPKMHQNVQATPVTLPQPSQVPTMAPLPLHSAPQPPPLQQPQMPTATVQLQQPLQTSGIPQVPFQPPLQPPMHPQNRPSSMSSFHQQYPSQIGPNVGFHPSGGSQHGSQPSYHSASRPPSSIGSFSQGQPSLLSQPPPQTMYQGGGSHPGIEFSHQSGGPMQVDRGSSWMPGLSDNPPQLPGPPPVVPGQMSQGSQPPRPATLSPEMEQALLQQVMSLTPEQINLLPPEQRNQVLQLQQMLRQ
ncbi:cleavage stimulating factor 64 isoform X2 [Syzygium oleosum]|uniref:cleavage stimulating factor 64 isoform X2 n=1 Tax=Syzygium oleosum TaxID=219896 RepID=UPI0011D28F3A|nr:cleavage stimulating factor 64 isoform X2 [Syzygium oleosum]